MSLPTENRRARRQLDRQRRKTLLKYERQFRRARGGGGGGEVLVLSDETINAIFIFILCLSCLVYLASVPDEASDVFASVCVAVFVPFKIIFSFLETSYYLTLYHYQDNFPFNAIAFCILISLSYVVLGLCIAELLLKSRLTDTKRAEKQLKNEKEECDKAIEEMKVEIKEKKDKILTLENTNKNLELWGKGLKAELQEKDKMKSNSELENKKLHSTLGKLEQEKAEIKAEKLKIKSQLKKMTQDLKEAKKLGPMLEAEVSRLELENKKLKSGLEREKDERLCDICADNYKNILLMPCKHFTLCKSCLNHKKWSECPLCREKIQSTVDVYC